ncbi:MAG: Swt1 family HEPN domain-containing protein [Cohaesibacter sp.]|nr:Swt1 family HEPN domain-containing protein [Cohaesibacter sp.]
MASTLRDISAVQFANSLRTPEMQHLLEASKSFDAITNSPEWAGVSHALDAANRASNRSEVAAALQSITQNTRNIALSMNHTVLPKVNQLAEFVFSASEAVRPLASQFATIELWRSSLIDRIGVLEGDWALESHLGISTTGFARISRLHDIAISDESFARQSSDIFEEELGDPVSFEEELDAEDREEKILDAGMNAELIAFSRSAYPEVLISAGFNFSIHPMASITSENGDTSGVIDSQHSMLMGLVENHLRNLIAAELQKIAGKRWYKTRIPHDLYRQWKERQDNDNEQKKDSFPLIYYAELMHLSDVICRKDNWEQIFHRFFYTQDDFQVSLRRLNSVRRAIAHYRPLVRADQIVLFSEAYRLLSSIGVKINA